METENFNITALDIKILEKKVNDDVICKCFEKVKLNSLNKSKQIVYKYLLKK